MGSGDRRKRDWRFAKIAAEDLGANEFPIWSQAKAGGSLRVIELRSDADKAVGQEVEASEAV